MPKYIAKQSVGTYRPGDEIKGLDSEQLQALLASGAIEEFKEPDVGKSDGDADRLLELEKSIDELKASNKLLTDEKVKSDQLNAELAKDNADLKAKVTELEKSSIATVGETAKSAKASTTK